MFNITLIDANGASFLATSETLEDALADVRTHWMEEEEGPQAFVIQEAGGFVVATVIRHVEQPDVCITTHANGTVELHECRYVLTEHGGYSHTDITRRR